MKCAPYQRTEAYFYLYLNIKKGEVRSVTSPFLMLIINIRNQLPGQKQLKQRIQEQFAFAGDLPVRVGFDQIFFGDRFV